MANTYKLTINDIPKDNTNLEFSYNQNGGSTQTLSIDRKNYICTLKEFSYTKAIYQPGEIQIELQLRKQSNTIISFSEVKTIHNAFIKKFLQLQYTGNEPLNIAENYYTFDVKIEKKGSGKPLTVQIQAFDPLKFLALDKFCMAYTCKKLIKDIIINSEVWPDDIPQKLIYKFKSNDIIEKEIKKSNSAIKSLDEEINNLKDEIKKLDEEIKKLKKEKKETEKKEKEKEKKEKLYEKKVKEKEEKLKEKKEEKKEEAFVISNAHFLTYQNNTKEFIQPYLVQYNESFLDFLVRVTNRCGEFFYYEGGKIHIGWEKTEPITIKEYVSVKFPQEISTAWTNNAIADIHNDYTREDGKNLKNATSPKVMRDSELASDENLAKIPPKDKYTSWQDFALFPGCYLVSNVSEALNSANLIEMIEFFFFNTAASSTNNKQLSDIANDAYEKSNFNSNELYFTERQNGNDLHPFSTNDTNKSANSLTAYCLDFYTNIRNGIEAAERSRLQIELGDHFYGTSLGSLIQFEGDEQQYIVVRIVNQIKSQDNNEGETLNIEVIPYTEGENVYPPSAHVEAIRSAKAQRAIVTHNQDPLKMNRVRVRYPWQGDSKDSTPWIRIALPMASDGSGFNFLPEVGDEAIINYENGNIEKPYVEGMVYSGGQTVPCDFKRTSGRVISSVNGHSIIFSDPGKMNPVHSLSPALSTISTFIGTPIFSIDDRKAAGGIELTDEYGFYSISMSSDKRAISVDSPFGKVDINAFTGITISAPNGNVRIEGKNIDIVAGNNLSISSGNNINTEFWPFKWGNEGFEETIDGKEFGMDLLKTTLGKFSPIDMKLIRTIMETFLRPIGGTMLIKSNRYLRLEAGKGSANLFGREFIKQRWINSVSTSGALTHNRATKDFKEEFTEGIRENINIGSLKAEIDRHFNAHKNNHREINNAKNDFERQAQNVNNDFNKTTTAVEIIEQHKKPKFEIKKLSRKSPRKAGLEQLALQINQSASALYKQVENATKDKVWKNCIKSCPKPLKKVFDNNKIKALMDEVISPAYYLQNDGTYRDYNDNVAIDKTAKRKVLQKALEILVNEHNNKNPFKITLPNGNPNHVNDQSWDSWVDQIGMTVQTQPQSSSPKDFFMKTWNFNFGDWMEQYAWDSTDDGKILISEKKGETLHIDQGMLQAHTFQVPNNELASLKDSLKN